MTPLKLTTIYSLVDPRNGETFYVGRTQRSLSDRLREHIHAAQKKPARSRTPKEKRLVQILKAKHTPGIVEIRAVTHRDHQHLCAIEQSWIDLKGGDTLTNSIRSR